MCAKAKAKEVESKTLPSWDLSSLYQSKDDKKISSDIRNASDRAKRFQKLFEGNVANLEADVLYNAVKEYEEISELLGKLSSYAYLVYAENMSNTDSASFYQNITEKINQISTQVIFFTLEINKCDEAKLNEKLLHSKLGKYAPWIRDVRIFKDYQLSDDVEKILHEKRITSRQSWSRLFDETIADLRFPWGKKQFTCTEILNKLASKNAKDRKQAGQTIGKVLGDNIKTFAHITNVLAKDKAMEDGWRNYKHPISSRNLSNLVEDEVTDALIDSVKGNYENLAHRYYKLKAKWFNKKSLDYWDRNAPLPQQDDKRFLWEESKDIVLDAYSDFSPEMAKIGRQFFDKNWIDAPPRDGKDSGAFSHPTVPCANPYILLNFQGKLRDVMTLAHELGHGVHQVLSASQGNLMSDTPLTLAETASVFGEQLTFRKLLDIQKSDQKKQNMIANKVEDMLNTVVRQIAFCDFEKKVHEGRQFGELSVEELNDFWLEVQKESLGPGIKFHDEYKYYWTYIPHFIHSPFYVYAYAFGDCLVNSLYRVYQLQPHSFEAKYIDMLKAGGTLRHKELLAPFGLDASKPDFWQGGLDVISEFIDQLE